MKKKKLILLIISLILIIIPYFINIYSIIKLIILLLGIILCTISITMGMKNKIFTLISLPIILLIFTYAIDYMKTYTLNLSPIYVIPNKINGQVSIYNSIFYRIYKCDNKYIFDNNYEHNFACNTKLISNIDINKLLNEPKESYKKYKKDFIKVTGKISKISGTSKVELKEYTTTNNSLNGYVKFNNSSKLTINLDGKLLNKYKIYDYITVVGLLDKIDKDTQELTLIDTVIEENNLYDNYKIEVTLASNCANELKEYIPNYYMLCLNNIYINYDVDKYELSYAIKDGKIKMDDLLKNAKVIEDNNIKVYELDKFKVLSCNEEKNILLSKDENTNYNLCEE